MPLRSVPTTHRWIRRVGLEVGLDLQRGIAKYHLGDYDGALAALGLAEALADARLTRAEQVEVRSAFAMLSYSRGDFEEALRWASAARRSAHRSKLIDSPFGGGGAHRRDPHRRSSRGG